MMNHETIAWGAAGNQAISHFKIRKKKQFLWFTFNCDILFIAKDI